MPDYLLRGSEMTPLAVAGCQLWLDAADALAFAGNPSDAVLNWLDKSGSNRTLTQGLVASQPTRVYNAQNGLPVVRFDGSDDYLAYGSALSGSVFTYLVAFRRSGEKSDQILLTQGTTSGFYSFKVAGGGNFTGERVYGYCGSSLNSHIQTVRGRFYIGSMVFNGASSKIRIGQEPGNTGTTSTATQTGIGVGGSTTGAEPWWGDIGELLIYNSALSDADRRALELYLSRKWGA